MSEVQFENIFNSSPLPIFVLQDDNYFKLVNSRMSQITGYTKEELLSRPFYEILHPGDRARVAEIGRRRLAGEVAPGCYEFRAVDRAGNTIYLTGHFQLIEFNGRMATLGQLVVITEQKLIEKALRESEEKYRSVLENIVDGYYEVDLKGNFTFFNDSLIEISGYGKDEINGTGYITYTAPADVEKVFHTFNRVFTTGEPARVLDWELIRKDGNSRFVEASVSLITDNEGNRTGFRGVVRDITERRQAEEALHTINQDLEAANEELVAAEEELTQRLQELQESELALRKSEEKYRMLFHNVNDGILMIEIYGEPPGRIVEVNEVLCSRYGYTRGEILNSTPMDFCTAGQRYKIPAIMKDFLANGYVTFEMDLIAANGREIPFEISSHIYEMDGKKVGLLVIRDITERKGTEDQLKFLSLHDSLTGLFNRAYFEQEMQRLEGGRCAPVSIIVFDVDGLKLVNDTMGHDKGDQLLKDAAVIIRDSFRSGDVVARIGGDEFAVLLPRSGRDVVEKAIQRIRDGFVGHNTEKPELLLSVSLGFATSSNDTVNMGNLFREADNNMYREKLHRSQSTRSAIVQTLMKALRARDFITEGHADRLQDLVASLAQELGLSERNITDLRLLAQFHDIGKVGIPDRILFKPGPLTPDEALEMQRHSEIGHRIAQSSPDLVPIADWILGHHEWWNGKGYPLGRKGKEIPLECRILAIADAYDAMTSDRPYRKAMPPAGAVAELIKCSGTQFDPVLVKKFIKTLEYKE